MSDESTFRSEARAAASTIMSSILPSLATSIMGGREQRVSRMSKASDDLTQNVSGVEKTVSDINLNLTDINESMKKVVLAMRGMATAVNKQNVSIGKGFAIIGGAMTALFAAAGLGYLLNKDDKDKKEVEPQTGLAPSSDPNMPMLSASADKMPMEELSTPDISPQGEQSASFQTASMADMPSQDATQVSADLTTGSSSSEPGFIIPGTGERVSPGSSIAPMMVKPTTSLSVPANDNRPMVDIRNSSESQLPKDLELAADSIVFSAKKITMKDRSRENRVSREIEALREKGKPEDAEGAGAKGEELPMGSPEPSMGLTPAYGAGAGSAGGIGSVPDSLKTGENGRLRDDQLAPIGIGDHKANPKAAEAFKAMRAAAAAEGVNLGVTGSYRTYERQVQLKAEKGGLAATPGKSNHGWGLAFDMDFGSNMNSAGFQWMAKNAARFGIQGPLQSPFEPWHWEYRGGEDPQAVQAATQQQQSGQQSGMGEGTPLGSGTTPGGMMPGMGDMPMMLPPEAGGGQQPATMMPPSIGSGATLNRESVAPTLNSATGARAMQAGDGATSNAVKDASSENPRIANPAIVGSISPDMDRLRKVFSGWGSVINAAAGR